MDGMMKMYLQSMYHYFGYRLSDSDCVFFSSTPKSNYSPSDTKPDADEADLLSAFEENTPKKG
jgi:hypothetical protein